MSIRVAVLTVSDTASQDSSADRSGPATIQALRGQGFLCEHHRIVPDDEEQIQTVIKSWCEVGDVDLILTTGGTGFGTRDKTPEAISPLIERHAPGLVHLLLSSSLKHTPLAALSRPIAGTIGNTLVVTLPGSVKAVMENIDALLAGGVLEHAVELIQGGTGKEVHAILAAQGPQSHLGAHQHHHHHHHHHHREDDRPHKAPTPRTILSSDPSLPPSSRNRISPYPLVSLEQALEFIHQEIEPLRTEKKPVTSDLRGYVLAEDVYAPRNVPATHTTNVDGYALRCEPDLPIDVVAQVTLPVVATDPPGVYEVLTSKTHSIKGPLPKGAVFRVNTGAPIPAGADAVIMVEDTRLTKTSEAENGEEKEIETLAQLPPGENVRNPGSDVQQGNLALQKGTIIRSTGGEIGTLAFVGRKEVEVVKKPIVAILSTGNEIIDLQATKPVSKDGWGGIFDTNRPALKAALEGMGYEVVDLGVVQDDVQAHVEAIKQGLEKSDVLLTTGGTSMGASDLLKPVIERHFGGTVHFGRVSIRPGKPTTFATIPAGEGIPKSIFALPGNPAAALVTFHVFVVPALRKLGGWNPDMCSLPRVKVKLSYTTTLEARTEFQRVVIKVANGGLEATSTGGQRSSRVASLSGANGLLVLPERKEGGPEKLEMGALVDAIVIGELQNS